MSKKAISKTRVVVGMSGGVDSSVAALLLKQQGYEVIGLFMKNWDEKDPSGNCTAEEDFRDVAQVCERLGISYYGIEFIEEYWQSVFQEFLRDYQAGATPNPDILCNREIKFKHFLKKAQSLGADYLATGHYAQVDATETASGTEYRILKGLDPGKDQSYFIYTLQQEVLSQVLFPIGHLQKSEVRKIAEENGLATYAKKDSTGICFIGERNFQKFLGQYIAAQPGSFKTLDGKVVGKHRGVAFYTLGQRKGLGLGGEGERWYVVGKDIESRTVYVERGDDHPALYADYLIATEISWVAGHLPSESRGSAKVRYRQQDQPCTWRILEDGRLRVDFDSPQRAMTPRQSVVFYQGNVCLGGAIIDEVGPTYYAQGKTRVGSSV